MESPELPPSSNQGAANWVMRLICILFLLVLALPTVQMAFHPISIKPVVENRPKVAPPVGPIDLQIGRMEQFSREFERYFNDNYGLRDFFIRLKNQFQYSVFGESRQVIIGRDGWLSDRSVVEVQQRHTDGITDEAVAKLETRFLKLRAILEQRGMTLILVPVPIKNTVYPEYFPDQAALRPNPTGFERLHTMLQAHPELNTIDAYALLSSAKLQREAFYKTDLHWTEFGASFVAREIVETVGRVTNRPVDWKDPDANAIVSLEGGDRDSMAVFWGPSDPYYALTPRSEPCDRVKQNPPFGWTHLEQYDHYIPECPTGTLPQALLLGNSFLLALPASGMDRYFEGINRLHDLSYFPQMLDMIPDGTKVVIWEFFELQLGLHLQDDGWWRQIDQSTSVTP